MRNLRSNARKLWYATYQGKDYRRDENGDITGDYDAVYSAPVMFKANLSATRGTQGFTGTGTVADWFGADIDYSLIISTCDMTLPIDEFTLIWKTQPELDEHGLADPKTAQYKVASVAHGQRHMKYAIKEFDRTMPEPTPGQNNASSGPIIITD